MLKDTKLTYKNVMSATNINHKNISKKTNYMLCFVFFVKKHIFVTKQIL